jgi:hypothetical protein
MNTAKIRIFLVGTFAVLAMLACNLNVNLPSAPKAPLPSLTPSTNDADAFEQGFQSAINQIQQNGTFSASVTQVQFSSWLALRAADYAKANGYDWPLKEVQAGLDNGKITLYGVIVQENVPETPSQIVFTPYVDANGEIAVNIESGQVGIVGIPKAALDKLTSTLRELLSSQLQAVKGRYKLTSLTIANGSLTVSGQINQ